MTYPQIIGLSGVARAGKDTVGDVLRQVYGYQIKSFSDVLNQALVNLNPWVSRILGDEVRYVRYAELIDHIGYEKAKEIPEVRALLQRMGTEVGRNLLGENIWVDAMFSKVNPGEKIAIVNVRFPNEAEAVWGRGGVVWEVTRPGYKPALGHVSDTALDHLQKDAYLHNDGTIEELAQKVVTLMDEDPVKLGLQKAFNR